MGVGRLREEGSLRAGRLGGTGTRDQGSFEPAIRGAGCGVRGAGQGAGCIGCGVLGFVRAGRGRYVAAQSQLLTYLRAGRGRYVAAQSQCVAGAQQQIAR